MPDEKPSVALSIRVSQSISEWLKQAASANRRSVNSQILVLLEQAQRQQQPGQPG